MTNIINGMEIQTDGSHRWFKDGKLHRENGPAIVYEDGTHEWWFHGKRHRENGPASTHTNGEQEWWIHDQLHREDGPALIWSNGDKQWYLNDNELTEEQFNQWVDKKNLYEKLDTNLLPKTLMKRSKI